MTSPLQTTMFNGVSEFYNGAATTSYRNIPGQTLTRDYGASPTSTKIMSFGGWLKRQQTGFYSNVLSSTLGGGGVAQGYIFLHTDDYIAVQDLTAGGSTTFSYITNRKFRDTSNWYHLWVRIDTTDSTAGDRVQLWVNGVRETSFATATAPSLNADTVALNQNKTHFFGHSNASYGGNVYLSDWWWLDGSSVSPVDTVGEFKGGVFIPKTYSGASFGNKGWHLKFDQVGVGSPSATTIGADSSGNSRHWTSTANTNVEAHDCAMPDSPENNFSTLLASLAEGASEYQSYNKGTYSEGNLKVTGSSSGWTNGKNNFLVNSGKWYAEVTVNAWVANNYVRIGVFARPARTYDEYFWLGNGTAQIDGTSVSSRVGSFALGDVLQIAIDLENNNIFFGKNNTWENSATEAEIEAGTSTNAFASGSEVPTGDGHNYGIYGNPHSTSTNISFNFGQDPTFAGVMDSTTAAKTPSNSGAGTADSEGNGKFFFAPPSGFLALCSANLPEPTIGPNSNTQAVDHFGTLTYTGNSQNGHSITSGDASVGGEISFKPDWTWIKARSDTRTHVLYDSSRGEGIYLSSDNTNAEGTDTTAFASFDLKGFTVGTSENYINNSSHTYVAWNWKANGSNTSTNDDGSIQSTVQANTTAGFSIVTFVDNNTNNATIGHGLGVTPAWIITKNRDDTTGASNVAVHWRVWHKNLTNDNTGQHTEFLSRNLYEVEPAGHSNGYIKTVGNSTYSTHQANVDSNSVNGNGDDMIAYCFAEVEGYSKFGGYIGNGNADGTFVFTGFRPAWVMVKRIDSDNDWVMNDSVRTPFNEITGSSSTLYANNSGPESNFDTNVDFLSNGFKARTSAGHRNFNNGSTSGSYIYMAFAEAPFKYANAR